MDTTILVAITVAIAVVVAAASYKLLQRNRLETDCPGTHGACLGPPGVSFDIIHEGTPESLAKAIRNVQLFMSATKLVPDHDSKAIHDFISILQKPELTKSVISDTGVNLLFHAPSGNTIFVSQKGFEHLPKMSVHPKS